MASRMNEFKEFVNRHQLVRNEVLNGKMTWQNIYENWVVLGENDPMWNQYTTTFNTRNKNNKPIENQFLSSEKIKDIWTKVKKINPDNVSKTLNTVQKVLQITQSFSPKTNLYNGNYNSWWE